MPKKNDEKDEKEKYRLWWEYLKRSENYRKFCEDFDNQSRKGPWPFKSSDMPKLPFERTFTIATELVPKELAGSRFWGYLVTFGNVFKDSFDEWYPEHKKRQEAWDKEFPPVSHLHENIEYIMDDCIRNFKWHHDREPTLEELKFELKDALKNSEIDVYLTISCKGHHKVKQLTKMCADLITEKRDRETKFNYTLLSKIYQRPSSRVHPQPLKKYLEVYDLKIEGLPYKEIIKKVGWPAHSDHSEDTDMQGIYGRYFRKAEKTVKNVESGIFP